MEERLECARCFGSIVANDLARSQQVFQYERARQTADNGSGIDRNLFCTFLPVPNEDVLRNRRSIRKDKRQWQIGAVLE